MLSREAPHPANIHQWTPSHSPAPWHVVSPAQALESDSSNLKALFCFLKSPLLKWEATHAAHTTKHPPLQALESDSGNLKALYRRAQAYLGNGDFLEAEMDIKQGLMLVGLFF